MSSQRDVKIRVSADVDQAISSLGSLGAAVTGVKAALDIVVSASEKVFAFLGRFVNEASNAELVGLKLAGALAQQGQAYLDLQDKLLKQARSMEILGVQEEEQVTQIQALLTVYGIMPDKIEKATRAVIGRMEMTGQGATRIAKTIAEEFSKGNEKAADSFVFAEAKAQSFTGITSRLSWAVGNVFEAIGTWITSNKELRVALKSTTEFIEQIVVGLQGMQEGARGGGALVTALSETVASFTAACLTLIKPLELIIRTIAIFTDTTTSMDEKISEWKDLFDPEKNNLNRTIYRLTHLKELAAEEIEIKVTSIKDEPLWSEMSDEDWQKAKDTAVKWREKYYAELAKANEKAREAARKEQEKLDKEGLEADNKWEEAKNKIKRDLKKSEVDLDLAIQEDAIEKQKKLREKEQKAKEDALKKEKETSKQWATELAGIMGDGIASAAEAIGKGEFNLGKALGGIISAMGNTLIQLGTAGLLAAALGTAAPVLFGSIAGAALIAPSLAAIAGGAALVGVGALMGGDSKGGDTSGSGGSSAGSGGYNGVRNQGTNRPSRDTPRLWDDAPVTSGGNVYNINFGRTFVAGSPAAVGKEIEGMLKAARRLG